jgi:hypothetical protein
MDVMVELLVVRRRERGELLVRVGREVVRMVRTVFHERNVRVVRQQQVVEVSYAINHDTTLRVMFNRAMKESMGVMALG